MENYISPTSIIGALHFSRDIKYKSVCKKDEYCEKNAVFWKKSGINDYSAEDCDLISKNIEKHTNTLKEANSSSFKFHLPDLKKYRDGTGSGELTQDTRNGIAQPLITYANTRNYDLPIDLENLDKCLYKSKKILSLKKNWDAMDGDEFTQGTWDGVVQFLTTYAKHIHSKFQRCIDIPKIYPSAAGSIDVDWETDNYGMLINFAKGGRYATYYADDKNSQITEGSFDPLSFNVNLLPIAIS